MNVLYYAQEGEPTGERLQQTIEAVVPYGHIEVYRRADVLARTLRYRFGNDLAVVVILCTRREELSEILLFRELLYETRIILILPDREKDTVARGHLLRPRFLTYADSDFGEVAAVLNKMFENYLLQKGGETV